MDNFKAIYKLLSALERSMDTTRFDLSPVNPETLELTYARWGRLLEMLADAGYIKGVTVRRQVEIDSYGIKLTLKGLEYLHESPHMKQFRHTEKGR